ncbi:hypothetical protein [Chlamydiifrater volucris]|uniref:hypothetical protein n=1 Tax=Chlamydiifrater volucris TaxID=2681470 RepID=UPI001BCE6F9D|nr:hypothetical protein [Chlamydiifrater volucris]
MLLKCVSHVVIALGHLLSAPILMVRELVCGPEQEPQTPPPFKPVSIHAKYLVVNPADFDKLYRQSIGYRQFDTTLSLTLPITMKSGFLFSCGYTGAHIDWQTSIEPKPINKDKDQHWLGFRTFQERSTFGYLMLSAGAYTLSMDKWQWSFLVSGMIDPEKMTNTEYSWIQGVISGKYQITDNMDSVFGIIGEAGLKETKARPLIGASYKPSDKVTVNCIYPINFSAEYECTKVCTFSTAFRLNRFRKRLYESIYPSSKGIFEYQGRAVEAAVKLSPAPGCSVKAFYGISVGSDISLSEQDGGNKRIYPFGHSAFMGGSAVLSF